MIRDAVPADYSAICALQLASWRTSYRGHLTDAYLGQPVERDLTKKWTEFSPGDDDVLIVHETALEIDGFAYVMGGDSPYVDNLHVSPDLKRGGIGSALMRGVAERLLTRGKSMVWLTVMTGNDAAIDFYEKIGATRGKERSALLYGQPVTSIPMTWTDLPALRDFGC